jgi:hypothetical protein
VTFEGATVVAHGAAKQPPVASFLRFRLPDHTYFWPQGIAVRADGTMCLGQVGLSGIGSGAIVSESPTGTTSVLWQSTSTPDTSPEADR